MQLYQRGKSWWVRFTHSGKQFRLPTGKKKKGEAQTVAADLLKKVERGEDPLLVPTVPPTLKEFADDFFRDWVTGSRKIKPKSKTSYLYGLSLLEKQSFYRKRMDIFTKQDSDMMVISGSPSTFNCAVRTLRRLFHLAESENRIKKCPKFSTIQEGGRLEVIKPSEEREISAILASKRIGREQGSIRSAFPLATEMKMHPHEIANLRIGDIDFTNGTLTLTKSGKKLSLTENSRTSLLRQCKGKLEWVFPSINLPGKPISRQAVTKALARIKKGRPNTLALQVAWPVHIDTGLRPKEMVNLRVEDIDFRQGTIYVGTSKSLAGNRYMPMSDRVKQILFAHIAGRTEGWLFPSPRHEGRPITRNALTQAFARARKLAGISKSKKLYSARHTFGTDMMTATGDPKLVMNLMGHKDLKITMRYLHPNMDRTAELLNERNREREADDGLIKPLN